MKNENAPRYEHFAGYKILKNRYQIQMSLVLLLRSDEISDPVLHTNSLLTLLKPEFLSATSAAGTGLLDHNKSFFNIYS